MELGDYVVVGSRVLRVMDESLHGYRVRDSVTGKDFLTWGMGYPLRELPAAAPSASLELASDWRSAQTAGINWPGV